MPRYPSLSLLRLIQFALRGNRGIARRFGFGRRDPVEFGDVVGDSPGFGDAKCRKNEGLAWMHINS